MNAWMNAGAFCVLAALAAALGLSLCSCSSTPHIEGGVAELRKVEIGGLEQTMLIRGRDLENPVLLYLHSGPGTTEMIPFRRAQGGLEERFTVVVWEQRGTGKSYSPSIDPETMTIGQLVSDAIEVTNYLRAEFGKDKIALVGHSWGTIIGMLAIARSPELYFAYAGSGQAVCPRRGERIGYEYALSRAAGNGKALKELRSMDSPLPYLSIDAGETWYDKLLLQRKWLVALGGETYGGKDNSLFFNAGTLSSPEYALADYIAFGMGSSFSLKALWPQVMEQDFLSSLTSVEVPVFFLQGRHDYNTPFSLVEEYYGALRAPEKELIIFENSGHHPMYEEAERYQSTLIEKLLPLSGRIRT
jgi:pimeloyl-ACP methyl ester carboxylesterase